MDELLLDAIQRNICDDVDVYLKHGEDANLKLSYRDSNYTLLTYCCENGYTECLNTLLKHGVDVNKRDEDGFHPLQRAISDLQCFKILYNHPNVDGDTVLDENGNTMLHLAAQMSYSPQTLHFLLQNSKIDLAAENKDGKTPIRMCRSDSFIEIFERAITEREICAQIKELKKKEANNEETNGSEIDDDLQLTNMDRSIDISKYTISKLDQDVENLKEELLDLDKKKDSINEKIEDLEKEKTSLEEKLDEDISAKETYLSNEEDDVNNSNECPVCAERNNSNN